MYEGGLVELERFERLLQYVPVVFGRCSHETRAEWRWRCKGARSFYCEDEELCRLLDLTITATESREAFLEALERVWELLTERVFCEG